MLKLVAEGHSNRGIAQFLCLSVKTVEKHRSNVMRKLDLHNTAMLTAYAIERGLVEKRVHRPTPRVARGAAEARRRRGGHGGGGEREATGARPAAAPWRSSVAMAAIAWQGTSDTVEMPPVVLLLTVVFVAIVCFPIAAMAARSYLARGDPGLVWPCCGAIVWAFSGLVANLLSPGSINAAVTAHNLLALTSAGCHLIGAFVGQGGTGFGTGQPGSGSMRRCSRRSASWPGLGRGGRRAPAAILRSGRGRDAAAIRRARLSGTDVRVLGGAAGARPRLSRRRRSPTGTASGFSSSRSACWP
ncbi:MAG: LuxR C-terminal-related transcriptional regulator [Chromatiales bacterium]|nr:LuxR C-terminal-related transcriptional regulator [Chromatiales bacterium]